MKKKSSIMRWLVVLWIISSQIMGAALALAPFVVLLAFRRLGTSEADPTAFNILLGMGYVVPIIFAACVIMAWVMFAKHKDAIASSIGLFGLIPSAILLLGMRLYTS